MKIASFCCTNRSMVLAHFEHLTGRTRLSSKNESCSSSSLLSRGFWITSNGCPSKKLWPKYEDCAELRACWNWWRKILIWRKLTKTNSSLTCSQHMLKRGRKHGWKHGRKAEKFHSHTWPQVDKRQWNVRWMFYGMLGECFMECYVNVCGIGGCL